MSKQINVLSGILSGGTIAFHAVFAKAFRSIPVGVFLSQGYFWQENAKFRDKEKYKTVEGKTFFAMTAKEWFEETSLTQEQQTRVRETLAKHKVLIEWLTDNPAKLYFHIDLEALVSVINQYLVSGISVSVDNRNKNRFKTQTRLGKEPKQDLVNNPNTTIVESLDSFEREGERNTPAPNLSNLKEEKRESGLVAPPLCDADEFFAKKAAEAQNTPLPKVAPKGIPPAECDGSSGVGKIEFYPTAEDEDVWGGSKEAWRNELEKIASSQFGVTAIASPTNLPGVTLVDAAPRPIRYDEYPNPRNANELKDRLREYFTHHPEDWRLLIENAKVNWMPEKLEETTLAYCLHQEKEGNMKRTYNTYKAGLTTWFMRQKSWDAQNNAPKEGGQTRQTTNGKANLNQWGRDESAYAEPQKF